MFTPVKRNDNVVYADPFAHIFESFFGDTSRCRPAESRLAPQFEIAETDNEYTVAAELPGIGKEQVDIVVDDDVLTVKGEKQENREEKKKAYHVRERRYGSFSRSFRVPESVIEEDIAAELQKGVLSITLPKRAAQKRRPKSIKVAEAG